MTEEYTESRVLELIATDRIDIPVSSMSGKLKRRKPKIAEAVGLFEDGDEFNSDRVYARVEQTDKMKARGMKEGIEKFSDEFPRHGKILKGYIEEQRAKSETHLYFGMQNGRKLTADDYIGVMKDLGFSEQAARSLYPELMSVSRNLARKRDEERSILIG